MACHKNLLVPCPDHDHNHDHHGHHHDHCHHDQFCGCINIATGAADSAASSAKAAGNSALLAQKILQNCLSDKTIKPGGGLKYDPNTCPGEGGIYVFCPDIIQCGGGLAVDENGDLYVNAADLFKGGGGLGTDENGKWYVKLADLIAWGAGLGLDANGKLVIVPGDFFKPGGGLATDGEGKWYVNLGDLFRPGGGMSQGEDGKWQVNPGDFISPGSGLTVGSDGKLNFDSNAMNTTAFENLLKKLRLPKWLTGDLDLYVDAASGSDVIVEGRGSRNLPFRSINACVSYACENYNVSDYALTIHVLAGNYTEQVNLRSYSRSGGRMRIVGEGSVNLSSGAGSSAIFASGGVWDLDNFSATLALTSQSGTTSCLGASGGQTIVNITRLNLKARKTGGSSSPMVINCADYATVNIGNGCTLTSEGSGDVEAITAFAGSIYLDCTSLTINGPYSIVARCYNRGSITRQWDKMGTISGNATGMRYSVSQGGIISTLGGGENYFPGSSAGNADSASYGVYS